jgi:hypothetical protein
MQSMKKKFYHDNGWDVSLFDGSAAFIRHLKNVIFPKRAEIAVVAGSDATLSRPDFAVSRIRKPSLSSVIEDTLSSLTPEEIHLTLSEDQALAEILRRRKLEKPVFAVLAILFPEKVIVFRYLYSLPERQEPTKRFGNRSKTQSPRHGG